MRKFCVCLSFPLSILAALSRASARSVAPLNYLTASGSKALATVHLTWGVLIISCAVVLIVGLLLAVGVSRGEPLRPSPRMPAAIGGSTGGLSWLWIGVSISLVALLFSVVWTMVVLADISSPANPAPFTIVVTGHQWWWQVQYKSANVSRIFETANEIHIPAGVPVKFELHGADVIHSFWIPALAGKTDLVPGQTNLTWLEADHPGTYLGQCTEYCGVEHAKMGLRVIADAPRDFAAWWNSQLRDARPAVGQQAFVVHCGACHTVRGTQAGGIAGPDLSHLMSRQTIAAGALPNTPGYLSGWIADPQSIKPGALMPTLELTGAELKDIRTYLETLH